MSAAGLEVIAGVDVGGTKLAIRAETLDGVPVADGRFGAADWEAVPATAAASWLTKRLEEHLPSDARVVALGVGAQGVNSPATGAGLERALGSLGVRAAVVNDGALLIPAAGLTRGIGIVAGTGSVGIAADAAGLALRAGGWGWVLGDEGGAAAIVRDATRAALAAHDAGQPDDGLLGALSHAFGLTAAGSLARTLDVTAAESLARTLDMTAAESLARAVNDDPTPENWAPRSPAVFAAADGGSELAAAVIDTAGDALTTLVSRLVARGAVGTVVVAAGGVITRQPRLADAFRTALGRRHPEFTLRILDEEPVSGAVVLARRLLDAS